MENIKHLHLTTNTDPRHDTHAAQLITLSNHSIDTRSTKHERYHQISTQSEWRV